MQLVDVALRHRCSYGNSSMANVRRLKDLSAPSRQDLLDKRLDMECIWMHLTIERLSKKSKTSFLLDALFAIYLHLFCWNYGMTNPKAWSAPSMMTVWPTIVTNPWLTAWIWPCWTLHQLIGSWSCWSYYCLLWSFIHRKCFNMVQLRSMVKRFAWFAKTLFRFWRSTKKFGTWWS